MDGSFPTFTTERLGFRQLNMSDAADVFRLFSDPETMRFDGGQTMKTYEEAYYFIQAYSVYHPNAPAIRWAVVAKGNGTFLGTSGFHKIDPVNKRAEIGGEILKPYWGQGIATEGMYGLINFGFNRLNFHRLTAMVSPFNKGALALIEKSPFKKEGRLRDWEVWGGKWTDLNVYGLLKSDLNE
ncbi:GNAT family N-acetyltransferase [Camelliibacillus cellulosilyticus]|uniref:GNAT family N-acetyltransferase n=1 Tax=Camelliibacillus cellulosilyticus TaxID=2174486 RepID=A0ABV9GLD1_9BACL